MSSKAKHKQRVCSVIIDNEKPSPCKVFQSQSPSSERVKLMKEIHAKSLKGKFLSKNPTNRAKKKKRDEDILNLPTIKKKKTIEFHPTKEMTKIKTYISGEDDAQVPLKNLPEKSTFVNVHTSFKVIDTTEGFRIPDVLTLARRKDVLNLCSAKTFRLFQDLDSLRRKKNVSNVRGGEREPCSSEHKTTYTTAGPYPSRFTKGISDSYHGMKDKTRDGIRNVIHQMERIANRYLLSFHSSGVKMAKKIIGWPGFKGIDGKETNLFSNLSVGKNVFLPIHIDHDAFYSITFVVSNETTEMDSEVLCYFCFPDQGVAVALRHGDVLLFNPLVPHCISSKRVKHDIFCASIYLKSKFVGGNDNSLDFTQEQETFKRVLTYL